MCLCNNSKRLKQMRSQKSAFCVSIFIRFISVEFIGWKIFEQIWLDGLIVFCLTEFQSWPYQSEWGIHNETRSSEAIWTTTNWYRWRQRISKSITQNIWWDTKGVRYHQLLTYFDLFFWIYLVQIYIWKITSLIK